MKKISMLLILFFLSTSLFAETIATYKINNKVKNFTDKDLNVYLQDIPRQFRPFVLKDKTKFTESILLRKFAALEAKKIGMNKNKQIQKEIETQIEKVLARHYLESKIGNYKFTEKELLTYYNKNKSKFKQKGGYKFGKVKFDSMNEALKAFSDISKNKNFEQYEGLDNKNPMAKLLKNRYEPADKLPKKLLKVLDSLKIGEVSLPFYYGGKYFIVKLRDKRGDGILPFEKVKDKIKSILKQEKKKELLEKIKSRLLRKYNVKIVK